MESAIKAAKVIITSILMIALGVALAFEGYSFAKKFIRIEVAFAPHPNPATETTEAHAISAIEISPDRKLILDAETGEAVFMIEDAKKYLKDAGYEYNPDTFQDTNAKYLGDCFGDAALSNNKKRIVFSAICLPGDLPQPWIGIHNISQPSNCPAGAACKPSAPPFQFLVGGSGRNFVWSFDDKTITYEADLGLSGMTETRTIDSQTGEILEKKNSPVTSDLDISGWKTYKNDMYGFEFKYPYTSEGGDRGFQGESTLVTFTIDQGKNGALGFVLTDNTVEKGIMNDNYFGKMSDPEIIMVDGKTAYKYRINKYCKGYLIAIPVKDNKTLEITLDDCYAEGASDTNFPDSQLKFLNQIISTFKFTDKVTINLVAQNNSGESGTATITDLGNGKTKVSLNLDNVPGGGQPTYIQSGTCDKPGQIKYTLTNVTNGLLTNLAPGGSETIINTSIINLQSHLPLIITVRQSTTLSQQYFSCGKLVF